MKLLLVALLFAGYAASADSQKTTISEQAAKILLQEKTISDLRRDLASYRTEIGGREQITRDAISQMRVLEGRLETSRAETESARQLANSKNETIRQLQEQLQQRQSSVSETGRLQDIAKDAVKSVVNAANTRHTRDSADLKTANSLAGRAADQAEQAAAISSSNMQALNDAHIQIVQLNSKLLAISASETKARRLTVVIACVLIGVLVVLFARRRLTR